MAYFSNGHEGDCFTEKNCDLCVHNLGKNCAVWSLHLQLNYAQHKETTEGKLVKKMLEALIPTDADGFSRKCNLFHPHTAEERGEQKEEDSRRDPKNKPAPWIEEWMAAHKGA